MIFSEIQQAWICERCGKVLRTMQHRLARRFEDTNLDHSCRDSKGKK